MGSRTSRTPGHTRSPAGAVQWALLLPLFAACGGDSAGPDGDDLPFGIRHVVVISIDTLRADHLGCYGHPFIETPQIDRLAAQGARFTQVMSAAPTTLASHTSLFTGKYPHTHGVPKNGYEVPSANEMLPEVLGKYGFLTAGFVASPPLSVDTMFQQGFEHYDADFGEDDESVDGVVYRPAPDQNRAALEWVDAQTLGDRDRLFLFLHYFDVHSPYDVPEPFRGVYSGGQDPADGSMAEIKRLTTDLNAAALRDGAKAKRRAREAGFAQRVRESGGDVVARAEAMANEYAAGVAAVDQHVGAMIESLRTRGLLDETLIVLTSDHGETLWSHNRAFSHGYLTYTSETHVPLILCFPGGRYAGVEIDTPVSNVDVLPTVLELLDFSKPDDVEGMALTPLLSGDTLERGPVFTEATKPYGNLKFNADPEWINQGKFQSVRLGRYKYMARRPDNRFRLYDVDADPGEQVDLLLSDEELSTELKAALAELESALEEWRAEADPLDGKESSSEAHRKQLDALGYSGEDDR